MNCVNNCRMCNNFVASNSVTVVGTNLVVNIPEPNVLYFNGNIYCIGIFQNIPEEATINMPVVISIGDGTTLYPLIQRNCTPVTARMLRSRSRYKTQVVTTSTTGSFKLLTNLSCNNYNNLRGLPVTTDTTEPVEP